jgi:hypothetical protein
VSTTDLIRANRPTTDKLEPIPDAVAERFEILDPESQLEMMELLAENTSDGEGLSINNLTKVGNPQGKSLAFTIPDPAKPGKTKVVDEIEGIVLGWQQGRTYYASEEVSDSPPDCSSRDDVHGFGEFGPGSEGNPSGLCGDCPMGQWMDNPEDPEKRIPPPCKPMANVLLLTEAEALPWLVRVPRTSLKAFTDYRKGLIRHSTGLARSIVTIGLEPDKNAGGTEYGRMVFSLKEKLGANRTESKAVANAALAFGEEMKKIITAPNARERAAAAAITATAERVAVTGGAREEGGVDFGEVRDAVEDDLGPTADELAEFDSEVRDAETSTTGAR